MENKLLRKQSSNISQFLLRGKQPSTIINYFSKISFEAEILEEIVDSIYDSNIELAETI